MLGSLSNPRVRFSPSRRRRAPPVLSYRSPTEHAEPAPAVRRRGSPDRSVRSGSVLGLGLVDQDPVAAVRRRGQRVPLRDGDLVPALLRLVLTGRGRLLTGAAGDLSSGHDVHLLFQRETVAPVTSAG